MESENRIQRQNERINNISYNSDHTSRETFHSFKGKDKNTFNKQIANFIWDAFYPKEEIKLENQPEIGSLNSNLETINPKNENSNSFPTVRESNPPRKS